MKALLLTAFLAFAQTKPETIRLEGTVVNTKGEGLSQATVRVQPASARDGLKSYTATSDAQGKYTFEDIAPGRYTLNGAKPGFLFQRNAPVLDISSEQRLLMLDIKMTAEAIIAGRVTDRSDKPVVDAQVLVFRPVYVQGKKQLQQQTTATTNDKGEYRIAGLPAGRYIFCASDRQGLNGTGSTTVSERNVDTFYPSSIDQNGSNPVNVAAGGELRNIDIHMQRSKVFSLRGKAAAPAGQIPIGISLQLTPKDAVLTTPYNLGLRPDGLFEYINVPPGTYVLQTGRTGNQVLSGRLEVTVRDSNVDNAVVQLIQSFDVNGTVRIEGGDLKSMVAPPAAPTFPPTGRSAIRLSFMSSDTEGLDFTRNWPVAQDGTFKMTGARPWKYVWGMFDLPQGIYVKSVHLGAQDITHTVMDLTSGASRPLDVVLSNKAADVSGVARSGVTVTLADTDGGVKTTIADQNGKFRFSSLAPGKYDVAAWEEIEPELASYHGFVSHFNEQASSITLAEGQHASVNPKLIPGAQIAAETAKLP